MATWTCCCTRPCRRAPCWAPGRWAWRGLGLLGWWVATALLTASLGLRLTLGLVRWIGVRRTRTVASVVGALLGASLFLASQWGNLSGGSPALFTALSRVAPGAPGWPGRESPLWYPARAAWSEPLPLLALLAASALIFAGTVAALTRQFTRGFRRRASRGAGQ